VSNLTPFQTVGPYLRLGLRAALGPIPPSYPGQRIVIRGRLIDGHQTGIPDGVLEWWHPALPALQRSLTEDDGTFVLETIKPGASMLVMTAGAIAGALALAAIPMTPGTGVLLILSLLMLTGGLINAVQTTMYALGTHVYPARVRATGVGTAVAVGRIGAISSGFAGAWALTYGSSSFFAVMAILMGVCFISLVSIRRHVAPVEDQIAVHQTR